MPIKNSLDGIYHAEKGDTVVLRHVPEKSSAQTSFLAWKS